MNMVIIILQAIACPPLLRRPTPKPDLVRTGSFVKGHYLHPIRRISLFAMPIQMRTGVIGSRVGIENGVGDLRLARHGRQGREFRSCQCESQGMPTQRMTTKKMLLVLRWLLWRAHERVQGIAIHCRRSSERMTGVRTESRNRQLHSEIVTESARYVVHHHRVLQERQPLLRTATTLPLANTLDRQLSASSRASIRRDGYQRIYQPKIMKATPVAMVGNRDIRRLALRVL